MRSGSQPECTPLTWHCSLVCVLALSRRERLPWTNESGDVGERAVIVPEVNLKYMGALARKCSMFITNDTGPMHIAWSLGVNVAAIFGPTNSHLQGPLNQNSIVIKNESLSCLGCNLTQIEQCPNEHRCMKDLSVEEVYNKIIAFSSLH